MSIYFDFGGESAANNFVRGRPHLICTMPTRTSIFSGMSYLIYLTQSWICSHMQHVGREKYQEHSTYGDLSTKAVLWNTWTLLSRSVPPWSETSSDMNSLSFHKSGSEWQLKEFLPPSFQFFCTVSSWWQIRFPFSLWLVNAARFLLLWKSAAGVANQNSCQIDQIKQSWGPWVLTPAIALEIFKWVSAWD